MALELKANAYFHESPGVQCETFVKDPLTGETLTLACDAAVVERNLCMDEAEGLAYIRRKISLVNSGSCSAEMMVATNGCKFWRGVRKVC